MKTKNYHCTDEVMLIKAKVLVKNALEDVHHLSAIQKNITAESLNGLQKEIDNALANQIGRDKNQELRMTTEKLLKKFQLAFEKLRLVKTLIEINFKKEKNEMLNHLGFNSYYKGVSQHKQKSVLPLLSVVAREENVLKQKFEKQNLATDFIKDIVKLSQELPELEAKQEKLKKGSKPVTYEQRNIMNLIYEQVMDIAKLAKVIFAKNEIQREKYIFAQIAGSGKSRAKKDDNSNAEIIEEVIIDDGLKKIDKL